MQKKLFLVASVLWGLTSVLSAQTWNNSGSNWSSAGSWTGGAVPANNGTADVTFSNNTFPGTSNLDANWNINSLTTSGTGVWDIGLTSTSATPATLTLQGGLTIGASATTTLQDLKIKLAQLQTWNVSTTASILSQISGVGGFTKTGVGRLTLGSGNTYTGGTILSAGIVSALDDSSFGGIAGALKLNGGTLNFYQVPGAFIRSITLTSVGGKISFKKDMVVTSPISGTGPLILALDNNSSPASQPPLVTLSGASSFTGGLTLVQDNYVNNPYDIFKVTVSGKKLSLGNGKVVLSSGTVLSINSDSNLGSGKKITLVAKSALIVANDSFDPAPMIASASTAGFLELGGSSYTRDLDMALIGDGTLTLGVASGQTVSYHGTLSPGAGNIYRLGGCIDNEGAAPVLILGGSDNMLTGTASVIFKGAVNLLNSNDFTGSVTISGGVVGIGASDSLGAGSINLNGARLQPLNGVTGISNNLVLQAMSYIDGSLTVNGKVNLSGGSIPIYVTGGGTVTFANVISNGTLFLESGTSILQANNTFSTLRLADGAKAVISSVSNLGGASTPIIFSGGDATNSGILETTANLTLSNPISFSPLPSDHGVFQVDTGTTLTLNHAIPKGNLYKTGGGLLSFSNNALMSGGLNILAGEAATKGSALADVLVTVESAGKFSGTGSVNYLRLNGGTVNPGFGTLIANTLTSSTFSAAPSFQFGFTIKGSPNYTNLANSGNGVLAYAQRNSGSFSQNKIAIFLATSTVQLGDVFKGAFYIQSTTPASVSLLDGALFSYYVLSPAGTVTFNGQKFTPLDSGQFSVSKAWVSESASFGGATATPGQVLQFTIAPADSGSSTPSAPAILNGFSTLYTSQGASTTYTYQVSGSPSPVFTLSSGTLPPGINLSSSGVLSGFPTHSGNYAGIVTASNGVGSPATQSFAFNVTATPSQWLGYYFNSTQLADPAVGVPGAMPQGDGISNLQKFLHNIDPSRPMTAAERAGLPVGTLSFIGGIPYLTFVYHQNVAFSGFNPTLNLQTSSDLQSWQTVTPDIYQHISVDPVTGDSMTQIGIKVTGLTQKFIRLNLVSP